MKAILFALSFLACFTAHAETITFDIFLWGNKIGQMIVSRETEKDGSIHYALRSNTKAKVLWIKKEGISEYDAWYKDGKLIRSYLRELENGKQKRFSSVVWINGEYKIDNYKKKQTVLSLPHDDIMGFYFTSQPTTQQVFYQPEAEVLTVNKDDKQTWYFKSSDGQTNIYRYQNNRITELEFQLPLASVVMKRINK